MPRRHFSRQAGFTLIELMISLTLGMLIIITIGYIYLGASRVSRSLEASSSMQEGARYAIERLGFDLRMAGYTGCAYSTVANVLNNPSAWQSNLTGQPVIGYESSVPSSVTSSSFPRARGDAITIVRADNSKEYIVDSHNPNSAQFQLMANHDLKQGEVLVVTDCSHAAVFEMTNVNNNNTIKTVNHNTGGSTTPGNYTKGFGIPAGGSSPFTPASNCAANGSLSYCGDVNGTAYTFAQGSRIYRLSSVTYYIATDAKGQPALYRQRLSYTGGGNAQLVNEEIVEGIEDMQISYGVDTSSPADKTVDAYVRADQVEASAPGATADEDWQRVLSVRVSLLMASRVGEVATTQPQTYTFNGMTMTPTDNRLRKVFTTTIAVRNRL
jgi:type IV pilus assembly protein PilW